MSPESHAAWHLIRPLPNGALVRSVPAVDPRIEWNGTRHVLVTDIKAVNELFSVGTVRTTSPGVIVAHGDHPDPAGRAPDRAWGEYHIQRHPKGDPALPPRPERSHG